MNLHVILRTCSESSVHFKERFIPIPKQDLILLCLKSLILSLLRAKDLKKIKMSIIDDHSSTTCVEEIKKLLALCPFETEFLPLQDSGNNASMKACYLLGRDSSSELLYLVEDDYLNTLECLDEMAEAYTFFQSKFLPQEGLGAEVALMPVDNNFHYYDNTMFSSPLVLGPRRHWRVNFYSNWTIFMARSSLVKHWVQWWKFSDYELSKPETHEDATLAPIFRSTLHLFTPVPTLALHVAGHNYNSPFTDWQKMVSDIETAWSEFIRAKNS